MLKISHHLELILKELIEATAWFVAASIPKKAIRPTVFP
jgi:hypothetical protein